MEINIELDEKKVWESDVCRKAFFINSAGSIFFRVIYLVFSIYWIFRGFLIGAAYLFFVMGVFFLATSVYLMFYPWYSARKTRYVLTSKKLIVPGILGRPMEIPMSKIRKISQMSTISCRLEDCASFEVEYLDGEDEEASYYVMIAVKKHEGLEKILDMLVGKKKGQQSIRPEAGYIAKEGISKPQPRVLKRWVILVAILIAVALLFGFMHYRSLRSIELENVRMISDLGDVYLYAELSKPIADRNLYTGLYGPEKVSCCNRDLDSTSLLLVYPYDVPRAANSTIYIFDKFTERPEFEKSREYIANVSICVRKGVVLDDWLGSIFGTKMIGKETCNYSWSRESCCTDWQAPR
jgi:hypothetical protein